MKRTAGVLVLLLSLPSVAAEDAPVRVVGLEQGQPAPENGCFIREPSCIDLAQELKRKPEQVVVQKPASTATILTVSVVSFVAGVVFAAKVL